MADENVIKQTVKFPGSEESWEVEITEAKVRGEDKYLTRGYLSVDRSAPFGVIEKLAKAIGVSHFVGTIIRDIIRPASVEASADAYNEANGEFSLAKWVQSFVDYFLPGERAKGGPKLADINKRMAEIAQEFVVYMQKKQRNEPIPEAEQNRITQLTMEFSQLGQLKAKKERHGQKIQAARKKE